VPRQPPTATFILATEAPRALHRWWQPGLARGTFLLPEAGNSRLTGRATFRVCFSAMAAAPAVWPAGWSGRTCVPFGRQWRGHRRAAAMASSLGHWPSRGAGAGRHGGLVVWPGTSAAPCLGPWPSCAAGAGPQSPMRPTSAPRSGDGPRAGAPPGDGYGPAASGGERGPARVEMFAHRPRR
jgi:hypothetical protein